MGCGLTVKAELLPQAEKGSRNINDYNVTVTGNTCKRGEAYGKQELIAPERVVTGLMENEKGKIVPVKTEKPVPKDRIFDVLKEMKSVKVAENAKIGYKAIENVCGLGVNVVVTKNVG